MSGDTQWLYARLLQFQIGVLSPSPPVPSARSLGKRRCHSHTGLGRLASNPLSLWQPMAVRRGESALSSPARGLVCFKLMRVRCWCCESKTFLRQKAGSWLASVGPCAVGSWQCLHALGCPLPAPASSVATRSRQVRLHGSAVLPDAGQPCAMATPWSRRYLSPGRLQMGWDSSRLHMRRLLLSPELALPQPGSPRAAGTCISTGLATSDPWQRGPPDRRCAPLCSPPSLARPTSPRVGESALRAMRLEGSVCRLPTDLGSGRLG